jgi:thiopeptide-type bacteriocin biosynthesis protein
MTEDHRAGGLESTFATAGFFVLRAPALPFDLLTGWGTPGAGDLLPLLRERLAGLVCRPDVREALLLAAPAVEERLDEWRDGRLPSEDARKIERTLVRYLERMCWRSTPFGLFAGTATGTVGQSTDLALGPRDRQGRLTRLDAEYLSALAVALARDPKVQPRLRYRPTRCRYRRGTDRRVFIAAQRDGDGTARSLTMAESVALDLILSQADQGATSDELALALYASGLVLERAQADQLVAALIRADVLVDDLDLPIVGTDPLNHLIAQLQSIQDNAAAGVLAKVRDRLMVLDDRDQPSSRADYQAVMDLLAPLPHRPTLSRLFHVILKHEIRSAELDVRITREVLAGADALLRLVPKELAALADFRKAFSARYDRQEIPLMEALDEFVGIGFDPARSTLTEIPPLLHDLVIAAPASNESVPWGPLQRWLTQQVMEAARTGLDEITLTDSVLQEIGGRPPLLADSFAVIGSLHAGGAAPPDPRDHRFHVRQVVGPTGGATLARFCALDPLLAANLQALVAREAELAADDILAEVVFCAHPRMGNVAARAPLRRFEIPMSGAFTSAGVTPIPLEDLLVSVHGQRVLLRSRSLGKNVRPRLTYADNTELPGIPAYRFLASLAQSEGGSAVWSWGALEHLAQLPRVVYGRCILALARWRFEPDEIERLRKLNRSGDAFTGLRRLREARRLPRWVMLVERDRQLPIDLENPLSFDAFLQVVGPGPAAVEEMFPGPGGPFVASPEGGHAHEMVLPFLRQQALAEAMPPAPLPSVALRPPRPRDLPRFPGGDWLYAKLYCSVASTDRVLREVVFPLVQQTEGTVSRWFFLRYGDPDWHLRLRFHGDPVALRDLVLPTLHQLTAAAGRHDVHRVTLDSYDPEHERYGGSETMAMVERVFQHDSEAAVLLSILYPTDAEARWCLTLLGMYRLLVAFGLDRSERLEVASAARDKFTQEAGLIGRDGRVLGQRFRETRSLLAEVFDAGLAPDHRLRAGVDVLDQRDRDLAPLAIELIGAWSDEGGADTRKRITASLLHMHANRVLPSHHRLQEAFLCDFLTRLLRAEQNEHKHPAGVTDLDPKPKDA